MSFSSVGTIGILTALLPPYQHQVNRVALIFGALAALALVTFATCRWTANAESKFFLLPPLLFLALLGGLIDATGGMISGLTPLVALPTLWIALYGTRRQLYLIAAATAVFFLWPALRPGSSGHSAQWRSAVLWLLLVVVILPAIQNLVVQLQRTAEQQGQLASSLAAVMRAATEHAIMATDLSGTITVFSEGAERMLGYRAEDVIGRFTMLLFHDQNELHRRAREFGVSVDSVVLHGIPIAGALSRQWTYRHREGTRKIVELTMTRLLNEDGVHSGWTGVALDVTTQVRTQQRFERLFEESPHGALLLDAKGTIERANPAFCAMIGLDTAGILGRKTRELPLVRGDGPGFLVEELIDRRHPATEVELTFRHSGGQPVHALASAVALRGPDDVLEGILAQFVDISALKRYERQLAHQAEHDPLTGLANRRRFDVELTSHVNRCRRYGATGALLMLDLDNFKDVNDSLGHGAGDQLIISLATLLRQRMRAGDVVSRLGGDEFAVLLPQADRAAAETVAKDIVEMVRSHVCLLDNERPMKLTTSVGVVLIDDPQLTPGELVSTADMTMYDAKESGRDRFIVHDSSKFAVPRMGARIAWGERISQALSSGQFVVHAQPVLDLRTGRLTGAELLIRMSHESGEIIMPDRFLYIAEHTDLIHQIDAWMITQAVEFLAEVQKIDPDFSIEVNLSGRSVGHPMIAQHITDQVKQSHINPHGLVLEITETAAVSDIEAARNFAEQIGELGCRFALDDFGAGFGSFYYLKHLLFDFVKIDGEFVAKSPTNKTDQLIVASIVGIARGLGKETIAEYVADSDILQVVTDLGVDHAQGFHLGRPDTRDALLDRIKQQVECLHVSPSAR